MPFDMHARAQRAMREAGFADHIPDEVVDFVTASLDSPAEPAAAFDNAKRPSPAGPAGRTRGGHSPSLQGGASGGEPGPRDLRHLLWSSIDNAHSRDLDQIEYVEILPAGVIRVLVGIADVEGHVPRGCPLDRFAVTQTATVYTGVATFPMLPERLSTDATSLIAGVDRKAWIVDMQVAPDGTVAAANAYPAMVSNSAKLAYDDVGPWLDAAAPLPESVAAVPGLAEQLRLQDRAAERLMRHRQQAGALDFETLEATPVFANGAVSGLELQGKNRARYVIENFMIAANSALAEILSRSGSASIQRVVRKPERWPRIVALARSVGDDLPEEASSLALASFLARRRVADPAGFAQTSLSVVKLLGPGEYAVAPPGEASEGHFGLAAQGYTHSTAPNRRYVDLVTQRLLGSALSCQAPSYSVEELEEIAAHCNERANAARKVERLMRKVAAATLMQPRVGDQFAAIVTGASHKGVYVRLFHPPVEGRVIRNEHGLDVGDRVTVRLVSADPEHGFIDFSQDAAGGSHA